jgi:hypothetical protein
MLLHTTGSVYSAKYNIIIYSMLLVEYGCHTRSI